MNAAIRAVVRTGVHYGMEVYGVSRGYEGLINGKIALLGTREVESSSGVEPSLAAPGRWSSKRKPGSGKRFET